MKNDEEKSDILAYLLLNRQIHNAWVWHYEWLIIGLSALIVMIFVSKHFFKYTQILTPLALISILVSSLHLSRAEYKRFKRLKHAAKKIFYVKYISKEYFD